MVTMMEAEDPTLSKRRRAVYTALLSFFNTEELMRAMCHWEENYTHVPPMQLRQFVADITGDTHPIATITRIHVQLVAANLIKDISKLEPDPINQMRAFSKGEVYTKEKTPATVVFQSILNRLMDDLDESTENKIFERIKNAFRTQKIQPRATTGAKAVDWFSRGEVLYRLRQSSDTTDHPYDIRLSM